MTTFTEDLPEVAVLKSFDGGQLELEDVALAAIKKPNGLSA
jgi:hypothetical protein